MAGEEVNEMLKAVLERLLERDLGGAIAAMETYQASHPRENDADRLFAIKTDYQMMADYWRHGFKDPQLPALYGNLLRRMYVLYANTAIGYDVGHSSFFSSLYLRGRMNARDRSPQTITSELEAFVQDVAVLQLEPEHKVKDKLKELYRRHQYGMSDLFDYILSSRTWTDGMADSMEALLLSPTIDSIDQQLLISAIMLSATEHYDMAKFRLLIHVYRQSTDEQVRQRALVGWVLALDADLGRSVYPEEVQLVEQLLEDEACCKELTELQKQLVYCVNAEADNRTIQSEIIPDLMKQPGLRMTQNGLEEQEEDTLNDILHPDEEERNLEKVEASFHRMMDMQKQGSDIYFGGFSQMKRFPFFNTLSNWFCPFFIDHPDVVMAKEKMGDNRFLQMMLAHGPFCNSDKYSFLLAFEQVLGQIPHNMREMLERGEAEMNQVAQEEEVTPTYIRRTYLQDLYRFFRVYPFRGEFRIQMNTHRMEHLFFSNPIFQRTHLEPYFNEVAAFLLKKNRYVDAMQLLGNYSENRKDFQFYMMAGFLAQRYNMDDMGLKTLDCYEQALKLEPGNERALAGYARSLFSDDRYEEALKAYDELLKVKPDKKSYLLNKAICLQNLSRNEEALKLLYRLNYEDPDDYSVNRVLAWTLTCDAKYKQAEKIYNQLLSAENPVPGDLLNFGYCLWFAGHIDDAADCFHRFMKETGMDANFILENEQALIRAKGITEPEQKMMLYIL